MFCYLVSIAETIILCFSFFTVSAQQKAIVKETSSADYIGFYQKFISGIRGQDCPMYPSCSNYALNAFQQESFTNAFILTSDRLMRCGHDLRNYDLSYRPNGFKYLDLPGTDPSPKSLRFYSEQPYYAFSDTIRDANESLKFIKSLINNNYYQQALLEIKRVEFHNPFNKELFINELVCLKALGEFEKAIYAYEVECKPAAKNDAEILYQLATVYYKIDNYKKGLQIIDLGLANTQDSYLIGRLYALKGLLYAGQYDWVQSRSAFSILKSTPYRADVTAANLKLVGKAEALRFKSPAKASILSLIPGAGYAYTGHTQTAISSFLLNSVFAFATYSSIKKENYGLATLTGLFSASFYIANIYGAGQSAKRFNEQQKKNIVNNLYYNINP